MWNIHVNNTIVSARPISVQTGKLLMSKHCCYSQIQCLFHETNLTCSNIHCSFSSLTQSVFGTGSLTHRFFSFLLLCLVLYSLPKMTISKLSQSIYLLLESLTPLLLELRYSHLPPPCSHQLLRDINNSPSAKCLFFLPFYLFPVLSCLALVFPLIVHPVYPSCS